MNPKLPAPQLPEEFTSDRWLAALFGLPSLAVMGLMIVPFGLDPRGALEHPFIAFLALLAGLMCGWMGWGFGHNVFWSDRLILSEQGLTYLTVGKRRFWRWEDIADAQPGSSGASVSISRLMILLKTDDPFRAKLVRWGLWKDARLLPLGTMWKSPFGTRSGRVISDAIRTVIATRQSPA